MDAVRDAILGRLEALALVRDEEPRLPARCRAGFRFVVRAVVARRAFAIAIAC